MKKSYLLLILFSFSIVAIAQHNAQQFKDSGIKHYRKKNYQAAIEQFSFAIEYDNKMTDAYIYRGLAKDAMDDFKGAISDFTIARNLDTNDVFVYVERAKTFMNMKEYEAAEQDFLKVTQLSPNSRDAEEAWENLAEIKYKQKTYRTAANYFTRILRFRPSDAEVFYSRGECKFFLEDYQGVIKDCDKALENDNDNGKAFALRAQAKIKLNDKEGACSDLQKAKKSGYRAVIPIMEQFCK
ncbi:MAG TPA: tetratricopeptide repeat protein [Bacteroidia bacterium]|nr:tetratricopeptide repeat protein [Bacteroidia bacterium]